MRYLIFPILIAILLGANFYLAHRLWRWIRYFATGFPFALPLIFVIAMTAVMILGFFKAFSGGLQRVVSFAGSCWMGIFAYLLMAFLVSDCITLLVRALHVFQDPAMIKFRTAMGIGATVLALAVSVYGVLNARNVRTVEYNVRLADAPTSELTIALITDVHLGAVGSESRLEKIVSEINATEPDVVCIAGDLFDTDFGSIADPEKAIRTLRNINAPYGVYACLGNHDAGSTLESMENFMHSADIRLLKDEYTTIGNALTLAGRLDGAPIGKTGDMRMGELSETLRGADAALPVVVLDHNPASVDTYGKETALVLSGHTHKGQIFPGTLFTHAMYSVDYGYYRNANGVQAVVSSGAGTWGLPMRVGTHCEVVRINLSY